MSKILGVLIGLGGVVGAPLFLIIAAVTLLLMWIAGTPPQNMFAAIFNTMGGEPYFVAIPLFTFAGYLLAESQAPQRLVALSRALFGWLPGGMAVVALCCCAFFTAFTGASGVTIIALGGFLMPALLEEKYSENFSLGLLTSGGSLGLLFPPSLPLIIYGMIAGASLKGLPGGHEVDINTLFLAGLLPGMLLIGVLSIYSGLVGVRQKIEPTSFKPGALLGALARSIFEVAIPFLIIGLIATGKVSIDAIAPLTAAYLLIVEVVIYRDISLKQLPEIMLKSMKMVGAILIILVAAFGFNNALTQLQVPQKILEWLQGLIGSDNKLMFLLLLNVFLLLVGCLLDIFSALLMVVPLIIPMAVQYGVSPVHLGVIFLTNLEIGYSTPPVGINLFIASLRFDKPVMKLYWASLPWIGLMLFCLSLITYLPEISLWLPSLLGPR